MSIKFTVGDPINYFACPASNGNERFNFDTIAGRYIVLSFIGSAGNARNNEVVQFIHKEARHFFNDEKVRFCGVSIDRKDKELGRLKHTMPGIMYFWDFERRVSLQYGAIDLEQIREDKEAAYECFTLVLDPTMRVLAVIPFHDVARHNTMLYKILQSLPVPEMHAEVKVHAPIMIVPRVFEPELCRALIDYYKQHGGEPSGFMQEKDGKTICVQDASFKRRTDCVIQSDILIKAIKERIMRRLTPEIEKIHQYKVTQIERFIVACYDAETGGFFNPHRDNTTRGTMHRKFACTINLNAGEYEGGDLNFPEYGKETYRAPTGGACVFSCSMLHQAMPMIRGQRYATLPFLYDDIGAALRDANAQYVSENVFDRAGNVINKSEY